MPEEHEDVEGKLLNSPEVYQQTKFMAWFEKAFPWLLVGVAALGLIFMIFLPGAFFQKETAEQLKAQGDLRLALLYTTGGAIAALGLLETYRKNTNDRAKANADINAALKNQEHQTKVLKEQIRQFNENAFKERKAERRERYTKAVEQLGDEKAPVRMGGVYTLVGLVDEWLEEESIRKYEDRLKEGQVIINNLCAYIRSPFTLASHYDDLSKANPTPKGIYKGKKEKFYADKATLDSEADVRLGIIKEIHDRLQDSDKNTPRAWSDFEYDFSGSTFFYPVDLTNSYYTKPVNFSGSTYQGDADFESSTYQSRANFSDSIYRCWADFRSSTYQSQANFSGSTYQDGATFNGSTYTGWANFNCSTYREGAYFNYSTYRGEVYFNSSIYREVAYFNSSTYQGWADFNYSTYQSEVYFNDSTYQGKADFSDSTYREGVYFSSSTYQNEVYFNDSTYEGKAEFSSSTYQDKARFSDSNYRGRADFGNSIYQNEVYFSSSTYRGRADFGNSIYQEEANLSRSTYQDEADFSGSIFCSEIYFGYSTYSAGSSRFTNYAPQFYDETNRKNTLFGSPDNDFSVENGRGYPIYRNLESLPLGCAFLTTEQKEYLADKFQEIEKIQNKLLEVKDLKEKAELSKKLQALTEELHDWCKEATTVKVEDTAPGEEDN